MGKKQKVPAPPDAKGLAQEEARLNRIDVFSPEGQIQYGFTNKQGQFQQGVAGEEDQAAVRQIDSPTDAAIRARLNPASINFTGQVLDSHSKLPASAKPGNVDAYGQDIFDRSYSMMAPAFEQSDRRTMNNLQARGIPIGSAAHDEQWSNIRRDRGETLGRLAIDSRMAAGQEQNRQYELGAHERATALGELASIFGGSYQPAVPGLTPSGGQPVNLAGNAMNAWSTHAGMQQQANQANAGAIGGIGSLAGTALGLLF